MDTGARRIQDDDLGAAVLCYESFVKNIFHIPGKELAIVYAIGTCVDFCVFNSLRDILYAYYLLSLPRNELSDSAGTGVEVINGLFSCEACKIPGHTVEFVCLTRVGLEE